MNNRKNRSITSRDRHPRIEALESRLTLSATFGGFGDFGDFGPPPHDHFEDFGPRVEFAQWSQDSYGGPRDRGDHVGAEDPAARPTMPLRASDWQPIAMMWQPSTGTLYRIYAPTHTPASAPPPVRFTEFGDVIRNDVGAQRSQAPRNEALNGGPGAAKPPSEPSGPLSLNALELLGAPAQLTPQEITITKSEQLIAPSAAAMTVDATAQLIAAATPGLEVSTIETTVDEPLSARDAAYANSADSQWLEITRDEAAQVQKLLAANRLPPAASAAVGEAVETSAPELRPEDYMAADWVNDLVLLAAANSADDAELFLALSGKPASEQTATKVGLSVANATPPAEPVVAKTEPLTPSRTLRWCGAVLAPVLFAAALRDRVKRKAANGLPR